MCDFSLSNLLFLLDDAGTKQFSHRNRLISSFHHSLNHVLRLCLCMQALLCALRFDKFTQLLRNQWWGRIFLEIYLFITQHEWSSQSIHKSWIKLLAIFTFLWKKFNKICLNLKFKLIKASKINVWGLSCRFILISFFLCMIFRMKWYTRNILQIFLHHHDDNDGCMRNECLGNIQSKPLSIFSSRLLLLLFIFSALCVILSHSIGI